VGGPTPGETVPSDEPLGTLRGAGIKVDGRRVGRVLLALIVVALAVLVVILYATGIQKNSQITRLHQHGVPVDVRVSGCLGLLGGSGSNQAGYACRGSFTLDGRRYSESIPGNILRIPGTTVRAVTVRDDPALLETARALTGEQSSGKVFVLPTILLILLLLALAALELRRRHLRQQPS